MRLSDYHYPYVVLISKFLLYFEVNLEYETSELVKSTQEMNNGSLSKMGFTKINGRWVSKEGDHGGSSSVAAADFDEEDQAVDMDFHNEEQPATNLGAGTSDENQKDVIDRRNGQGPKHLKFFLLVFAKDEAQAQSPSPRRPKPKKPKSKP